MADSFDLVLPDGRRVPIRDGLTLGRGPGNALELSDPSVSRQHARVTVGAAGVAVEDAGSSSGTWVDGRRIVAVTAIADGSRLRLGNTQLVVERRRPETDAGRTAWSPIGASAALPAATPGPRLRSGYALKRLDVAEGERRWVLKDLRGRGFVRLSDADARLVALLDGRRTTAELVTDAERVEGRDGPMLLATLLADLGAKGMLAGSQADAAEPPPVRGWRRLVVAKQWQWTGAGEFFHRLYASGGRALFTRDAYLAIGVVAVGGLLAFAYLVAGRYGTPFVVANKIGLGGLVFLLGRLAIAAVHETAHGLTLEHYGRRVGSAGLKLVLVFPYAFVDTSDAWFESRRHRIAVTAAGPISDFTLGGLFALVAFVLPAGTLRDIFFQLTFAAYVGAIFNLNPFLPRDGYQLLADMLREPKLRLRGRYSELRVAWLALAALFSVAMSLHYEARFAALVPTSVAWAVMGVLWVAFFVPVGLALVHARARRTGSVA